MLTKEDKIVDAVDNLLDSWSLDDLLNFAFADRLHYFMCLADDTEINCLLEEFGNANKV